MEKCATFIKEIKAHSLFQVI